MENIPHIPQPLGSPELVALGHWAEKWRRTHKSAQLVWRLIADLKQARLDNQRLRDEVGAYFRKNKLSGVQYQYSTKQVAQYLRVAQVTVRSWCTDGSIKAVKVGTSWRIPQEALKEFLSVRPAHAASTGIPSTASASETEETAQTLPPLQDVANSS